MLAHRLANRLQQQKDLGLYRCPPVFDSDDVGLSYHGRPVIDFGSNDYLGLSASRNTRSIVAKAFTDYEPSTCASRLASGSRQGIADAERAFADHFGYESALFFSSGYQANCALLKTLLSSSDHVFFDKRIHASMVDGLRSTGAQLFGYRHSDLSHLKKRLVAANSPLPFILTESLFSMDGDCLDCSVLKQIASDSGAVTIIDEAHAFGAMGEKGRGLAGRTAQIAVGTLGKAFAFYGAFVLGPRILREALYNFASPFIYTTGTSVAHAQAARELLKLVAAADEQRDLLRNTSSHLKELLTQRGFPFYGNAHIVAVQVGDESLTATYARELLSSGFHVLAARSPTVPEGKAILRLSLSANHSFRDIQDLVDCLCRIRDAN
jgi:8-amino-7-oxononanoate synthase